MKEVNSLDDIKTKNKTAITIGKFDGIHRGHELLTSTLSRKKSEGFDTVLITFDRSPKAFIENEKKIKTIISSEERINTFKNLGLLYMAVLPFDEKLRETDGEDFIKELVEKLNMKFLVCGTDFKFGRNGKGDIRLLKEFSKKYDFTLSVIPKLKEGDTDISSSRIRENIKEGKMEDVRKLLGYPFYIYGEIVHGDHIGTDLGTPTINLLPPDDKLLPPNGVYITEAEILGRSYHGLTNVGIRPTFSNENRITVETHILDFKQDVYEKYAYISFFKYLRPEIKFENKDALKEQLKKDKKEALFYFNSR